MNKNISVEQIMQVATQLMVNIQWSQIPIGDVQQMVQDAFPDGYEVDLPTKNGTVKILSHAPIIVDYRKQFSQMLAEGNYDYIDSDISPQLYFFKERTKGCVTKFATRLFHFDYCISSEEATERIHKTDRSHPWEVAEIEHLLAFGAAYPEKQRRKRIAALGFYGQIEANRSMPVLWGSRTSRNFVVRRWGDTWPEDVCFLAVRELCFGF